MYVCLLAGLQKSHGQISPNLFEGVAWAKEETNKSEGKSI